MDPANPMARLFYIWVLLLNHRNEEVDALMRSWPPEVHTGVPAQIALFLWHASAGEPFKAQALITTEIEAVATAADVFPRLLAQGYAMAGIRDRATHWLAIAVDRGFINYPFLSRYDPCFETLRSDPQFQQLLEVARGRWEQFEG